MSLLAPALGAGPELAVAPLPSDELSREGPLGGADGPGVGRDANAAVLASSSSLLGPSSRRPLC